MSEQKWYLRTQDEVFGPESKEKLIEWAQLGRVQPGQEISDDNIVWRRVEEVPFLDLRFSIDIGDGNPRGPFNKAAAEALLNSGRLPQTARLVETREPFPDEVEQPIDEPLPVEEVPIAEDKEASAVAEPEVRVVEKIVEKEVIKEVAVEVVKEVPVEVIKEVRVEVPVEKVVIKEVIKEVPVEVVKEKIIVDETRVKELEAILAETKQESANRESKLKEQVEHLEDELRRLPQAASEVADIQAAMFGIMTKEAEDLANILEVEKREFEEYKTRYQERADRLNERRRAILKRSGANIEEMTRKALVERPEDPRLTQLRREHENLQQLHEKMVHDDGRKIKMLEEQLRESKNDMARTEEGMRDIKQLQSEVQALKEQLQLREREVLTERERNEKLMHSQAVKQQVLMARLATLESPSIGTSGSLSTNQSREAKQVKLPSWMGFGRR